MKKRLNLEKEYSLSSSGCKRLWDETMADIETIADRLNMTRKEKNGLIQRSAASIVYGDLEAYTEYLQDSADELAELKIQKNKVEMQRMSRVYVDHAADVARIHDAAVKLMK